MKYYFGINKNRPDYFTLGCFGGCGEVTSGTGGTAAVVVSNCGRGWSRGPSLRHHVRSTGCHW